MLKIFKALLLIALPSVCFAQSNFKPGYVVTLKGDTLRGSVDYKEWAHNPVQIDFKTNQGDSEIFNKTNAIAFGVDGFDYYKSFTLPLSMDETELSGMSTGLDSTVKTDTYFLRAITKGRYITLYEYTDPIKKRFIVVDNHTNQAAELSYHTFFNPQDNNQIITRDYFKNQLIKYAMQSGISDQSFFDYIRTIKYDNDVVKVVNKINRNSATQTVAKNRLGTRLVAGASENCAIISYNGTTNLARNNQLNKNYFTGVAAGIDFLRNASVGKFFLRLELGFYSGTFNASGYDETNVPTLGRIIYQQTYQQIALSFAPGVYYNFYNSHQLKAFGALSFAVRFYHTTNNNYTESDNTRIREQYANYPMLRNLNLIMPLKAGVTLADKFQFYLNYELPTAITNNYRTFDGSTTNLGLGFNYLFNIK